MSQPRQIQDGVDDRTVHVALEFSMTSWKLASDDWSARRRRSALSRVRWIALHAIYTPV
jgi:hypothetical protein